MFWFQLTQIIESFADFLEAAAAPVDTAAPKDPANSDVKMDEGSGNEQGTTKEGSEQQAPVKENIAPSTAELLGEDGAPQDKGKPAGGNASEGTGTSLSSQVQVCASY